MPDPRRFPAALLAAGALGMPVGAVPAHAGTGATPATTTATASSASDRVDFRFADPRIDESSGLALSVRHPHTVWTVNDSGDSARVFAVDTRTGATVGVHTFGATVRDVEALAITPQGRMLVADIGDNRAARTVVRVFWFDEPALGSTSGPRGASWELSYPDGPHDAESLAVDPRIGRVLVVTKGSPGGVYALPSSPSRSGVNRLAKVGPAPDTVTDAVFLPDGSALAVRTYTSLHLLDPRTWTDELSTLLPLQPQGETLAVAPGGASLLVGSEGEGSRVQQVALPRLPESAGHGSSSTTSSQSPSSTASTAGGSRPPTSPSSSPARTGAEDKALAVNGEELAIGLGASAGLVLLALLVVHLAQRRRG